MLQLAPEIQCQGIKFAGIAHNFWLNQKMNL